MSICKCFIAAFKLFFLYLFLLTSFHHRFDWEQPNFFDAGVRNAIINFILERQHFVEGEETPDNLGIEKLLEDRVYHSAYPLHDVSCKMKKSTLIICFIIKNYRIYKIHS